MPDVFCGCGKQLRVPERLIGKKVKCPACGRIFAATALLPEDEPPTSRSATRMMAIDSDEVPAIDVRGDAGPIRFTCSCGQQLLARRGSEGQKLKCAGCGRTVKVPTEGETRVEPEAPTPAPAMRAAKSKCPRCSEPLPAGETHCGKCHLNLLTGQVELPPDPDAEEVASVVESIASSITAPLGGLGMLLLVTSAAAGFLVPAGWAGKAVALVAYSFLIFPVLRARSLGEGIGPKSRVIKAITDEWVLPWIATLLAGMVSSLPLAIAAWAFRPAGADLLASVTSGIVPMLLTIGTLVVISLVLMRAACFGTVMHGADPFAVLDTAKAFPLETLLAVLYLVAFIVIAAGVALISGAFDPKGLDPHGIAFGAAVYYAGGVWAAFLGSWFHRKRATMPGRPTTAPKSQT